MLEKKKLQETSLSVTSHNGFSLYGHWCLDYLQLNTTSSLHIIYADNSKLYSMLATII